ncbi:alpha/beta fold hydrolase [Microbacterium tumbae]
MSAGATASDYAADATVTRVGNGETVLLMLHGLGGDRNQPLGLLTGTPENVTVIAPDQRAHGESNVIGEAEDFSLDGLADDATALLEARGLADRPLIVAGISMGAAVALRLLERADHDLRGSLLIRPAFESEPWPAHLQIFREVAALLRSEGAEGLRAMERSPLYRQIADVSPQGASSIREQFTKLRAVERVVRLENVPANASLPLGGGSWTPPCPVTVVGAAADPVHPLRTAHLWHEYITDSALAELPSRDRQPTDYQNGSVDVTQRSLSAWAS